MHTAPHRASLRSGIVLHPLFPIHAAMRWGHMLARWMCGGGKAAASRNGPAARRSAATSINGSSQPRTSGGVGGATVPGSHDGGGEPLLGYADPAVAAERSAILAAAAGTGPGLQDCDIIIAGLVKTYPLPAASAAAALGQEQWARHGSRSPWYLRPLFGVAAWAIRVYYAAVDALLYLCIPPSSAIGEEGGGGGGVKDSRPVRRAVDGLFLTVRRGEALGFCGVNGAGKSTTINALSECVVGGRRGGLHAGAPRH